MTKASVAKLICAVAGLFLLNTGFAESGAAPPANKATEISNLTDDMAALEIEREEVLREVAERYKGAQLSERSTIEAESAQLWAEFEVRYLTLLVEYYTLTGNGQNAVVAQLSLDQLLAESPTGQPQILPRDAVLETAVETPADVQGVTHVR